MVIRFFALEPLTAEKISVEQCDMVTAMKGLVEWIRR